MGIVFYSSHVGWHPCENWREKLQEWIASKKEVKVEAA